MRDEVTKREGVHFAECKPQLMYFHLTALTPMSFTKVRVGKEVLL